MDAQKVVFFFMYTEDGCSRKEAGIESRAMHIS